MMSNNPAEASHKHLWDQASIARMPEEEESEEEKPDNPRKWSKLIQDQHLTYSKDVVEPSHFGNCMSCHMVGLTNFFYLCQADAHFVHCIFQEQLLQEEGPPFRQVVDPILWAGLHSQLGANAYVLHQMQLMDYLLPAHWGRDAAHSLQFLMDDDNDLINHMLDHLLSCMNVNLVMEHDLQFLSVVENAMNVQALHPSLTLLKATEEQA